jgi:hypothetical protein
MFHHTSFEPLAAAHNSVGKLYALKDENELFCANICKGNSSSRIIFFHA